MKYIVALDQGTTSSRAILFDESQTIVVSLWLVIPKAMMSC